MKEENEKTDSEAVEDKGGATAFLNLEELIKNHIEAIDKLKDDLSKHKEMYEDTFTNNPTYREHVEKVKEANKAKLSVRLELSKQPSVAALKQKVDDIKFDISESQKTLGDLLTDFVDQTGATEIEARNGKIYAIIKWAKLVMRSSVK